MPFDQIIVRNSAEFEAIKIVNITGEVRYPGPYAIVGDNFRISYLVEAAGGITQEANPKGGRIYRQMDSAGYVITKMHKALRNDFSPYNIILDEGDQVYIPRNQSIVQVRTQSTRAAEIYTVDFLDPTMSVTYRRFKRAKYYINNYMGGFAKNTKRSNTIVETKSGAVKKTRNFILFKVYPKPEPGSVIIAFQKEDKSIVKERRREEKRNMTTLERLMQMQTIITVTTSTVTTAITTLLLIQSLE